MPNNEPDTDDVLVARAGPVLTITLNRPQRRNALSVVAIGAMIAALEQAARDDVTRAVVLLANGPDFCTGIDLGESNRANGRPRTGHLQRRMHDNAHRLIRTLQDLQLPVVAGARGWVAGIGNAVALSADVVIADPTARFWVPFVGRGLTPDSGTTYLLPRLIGTRRAKEMVLRSRPVDASTAEAWGLISEVVDTDELDTVVTANAAELAAGPTIAIGLAKALLHRNTDASLPDALHSEAVFEELAIRSDDFKEGMKAFVEKRAPEYRGW